MTEISAVRFVDRDASTREMVERAVDDARAERSQNWRSPTSSETAPKRHTKNMPLYAEGPHFVGMTGPARR